MIFLSLLINGQWREVLMYSPFLGGWGLFNFFCHFVVGEKRARMSYWHYSLCRWLGIGRRETDRRVIGPGQSWGKLSETDPWLVDRFTSSFNLYVCVCNGDRLVKVKHTALATRVSLAPECKRTHSLASLLAHTPPMLETLVWIVFGVVREQSEGLHWGCGFGRSV